MNSTLTHSNPVKANNFTSNRNGDLAPSPKGIIVVSLDFELYWGVKDIRALESYKPDARAIRLGIPALLKLFAEYGVPATWAPVGMLFCKSKDELLAAAPAEQPQYAHSEMSPYDTVEGLGPDERSDPSCSGRSLIQSILATPH